MRAPLSVVIPTLNAADRIGPTITPLMAGLYSGLIRELIISDGGSTDDIETVAEGVGATFVVGAPGRGDQLRRGAEAASGDWLLFLHADTRLPESWEKTVKAHIEGDARAACFRLSFDQRSFGARWVAGWANWRTWLFALPYGDQALLISRRLYDAIGGYPAIPLMEDVALVRALGRRRLTMLPLAVVTAADRYQRDGWFRRGAKNWRCLALYFVGVPPEKIVERYR